MFRTPEKTIPRPHIRPNTVSNYNNHTTILNKKIKNIFYCNSPQNRPQKHRSKR